MFILMTGNSDLCLGPCMYGDVGGFYVCATNLSWQQQVNDPPIQKEPRRRLVRHSLGESNLVKSLGEGSSEGTWVKVSSLKSLGEGSVTVLLNKMATSGGFLNPPAWDEKTKDFEFWLREVHAWKKATANVTGLKGVHSLQLALHLPEGSEIRRQVFDSFSTEEMAGEDGWKKVMDLLKTHYSRGENISAFEAFKEFKTMERKPDQGVDQYIMAYELLKNKIKRYELSISERVHGLNLLVSAGLSNEHLRIAMREVDEEQPMEMYEQAQKSLKKYFGRSAITSSGDSNPDAVKVLHPTPARETMSVNKDDYETFIAW